MPWEAPACTVRQRVFVRRDSHQYHGLSRPCLHTWSDTGVAKDKSACFSRIRLSPVVFAMMFRFFLSTTVLLGFAILVSSSTGIGSLVLTECEGAVRDVNLHARFSKGKVCTCTQISCLLTLIASILQKPGCTAKWRVRRGQESLWEDEDRSGWRRLGQRIPEGPPKAWCVHGLVQTCFQLVPLLWCPHNNSFENLWINLADKASKLSCFHDGKSLHNQSNNSCLSVSGHFTNASIKCPK